MNITMLSKETSCAILQKLINQGLLQEEELLLLLEENPSNEMRRMTDVIHNVFCNLTHSDAMDFENGTICGYYSEEVIDGTWSLPFHKGWFRKTIKIMQELSITTEDELSHAFKQARSLVEFATGINEKTPAAYALALRIMNLTTKEE